MPLGSKWRLYFVFNMFARIAGVKLWDSCDQRCLKMDDLGEKIPNFPYCLTHVSALVAVVTKRNFVNIFGEKSSKEPEILKLLEFLPGYEIKFGDGLFICLFI